jgi:hypothetical protein
MLKNLPLCTSLCAATLHITHSVESPDCRDCGELDTESHVLLYCPSGGGGGGAGVNLCGPDAAAALRDPRKLLRLLKAMQRTHIGA